MPAEITMPKLGLTMTTGSIVRWMKAPGDKVALGEPLLEVSTEKISYEVESPVGGTLLETIGREGDEFEPGAVIGLVAIENEALTVPAQATAVSAQVLPNAPPPAQAPMNAPAATTAPANGARHSASPAARRMAREHSVDLAVVTGSGPRGRITLDDIAAQLRHEPSVRHPGGAPGPHPPAATHAPAATLASPAAPPPGLPAQRRTIFRRMSDIGVLPLAQVETHARVDALHALIERRQDFGWTAFVAYAAARLLRDHPLLRTDARTGVPHPACDIGIAADTPNGLLVPVIRDAAQRTLREMQDEISRLAGAAREGRLGPSDMSEAAFTISNVGPQGVERVAPLVDPPQTAILGMGAASRRPAVVRSGGSEAVQPAWMLTLVLSFDHRFVDGAPAARFLAALAAALGDPGMLL
jgi:pyruvate/2-oxoglutarate dehydrogenase complex dihydrolipoamide acyltransferase (E2) component